MVSVISSGGGKVNVQIKGVAQAAAFIRAKKQDIKDGADAGVFQAANFVQQEVQESIIGRRPPSPKNVDTGRLANSIITQKIKDAEYKVEPAVIPYPGTNTDTKQVARALEPRSQHFTNTLERTRKQVQNIVQGRVDLFVKGKLTKFKSAINFF